MRRLFPPMETGLPYGHLLFGKRIAYHFLSSHDLCPGSASTQTSIQPFFFVTLIETRMYSFGYLEYLLLLWQILSHSVLGNPDVRLCIPPLGFFLQLSLETVLFAHFSPLRPRA
jgi:hypothetical protein